jgi:hypothetical protein
MAGPQGVSLPVEQKYITFPSKTHTVKSSFEKIPMLFGYL